MRNQTSFRLTTTLLPTDTTANTTTVINKVDSNGDKFYPTFTDEETVVLTNDDRTVMEITKAVCNEWAITFTKRWLDDKVNPTTWVEDSIPNRKLTRNPWTLAFITACAGDILDKDGDITWSGNQTYTGNMTATWNATYNWYLITNKWVKYPTFDSLEELQAYNDPFPWMFAVVNSDWNLYRYNAVDEEWSVVTTSTPVQPAKASTTAIGTVRGATDAEVNAWTWTGSQWELLILTPAQQRVRLFSLVGTTDTVTWQAILDYTLWWGTPIIKFQANLNSTPIYYYLENIGASRLYFGGVTHYNGSAWQYFPTLKVEYTWSTVTAISRGENSISVDVYMETEDLTKAQEVVDARSNDTVVTVTSDYGSNMYYKYYLYAWNSGILKFKTLDWSKTLTISINDFTATAVDFS